MKEIGRSESEAGNGHFLSTTMRTKETEINQDIPDQIITTLANCSLPTPFESDQFNEVTATLCALYLFFGLFCALFGYRCFKAIMFLTGFIFGSIIVYLICLEEQILPMWANTLIAVSAGLLFGLITLLVQYVGIFMLGFHGGLLLGLLGLVASDTIATAVNNAHNYHSPWISVAVLLSTGLVVSLFNLYFQKSLTIFCSALYGGAVVATGLDYFVENSVMLLWVWDKVRAFNDDRPQQYCWFSWAIMATWPVITVIGIFIQCIITDKGIYHDEQFKRVKRRAVTESREERKQRKYRYLYQVRTCHGDVISQPIAKKYVHQVDDPCP